MSWLLIAAVVFVVVLVLAAALFGLVLQHIAVPLIAATVGAVQFIGRFALELLIDIVRAAIAIASAVVTLPVIIGALALGRWQAARRMTTWTGRRFTRVGRRLGGIVTRSASAPGHSTAQTRMLPDARRWAKAGPSGKDEFPGWRVVDRLTAGGSGAALLVAEPTADAPEGAPSKVVIKCFDLSAGSPLTQMVRESRALEGARTLGLVVAHGLDEHRFWYAMKFIPGPHMAEAVKGLHGGGAGLDRDSLLRVLGWERDLLAMLREFHAAGLWHKDVKPENIIVNDTGAHLVDLGLITPLHSSMTLTTHGTEYFRDPELVRQALRGTIVADVDGARFDVYSAGAVLYYMVEGTFPAHGNLSRFSKSCPDVVRWIIRRAMADYQQRYTSAEAMLTDVAFIAGAVDPTQVRPADLPSFTGDSVDAEPAPASASVVHGGGRPRLEVSDWWTGRYHVLDPVPGAPNRPGAFDAARRSKIERAAAKVSRRHARRQRWRGRMAGAGSFLVGAALIAVAITLGPSLFVDRSPTTVAAVTALPGGTGRILVLNDDPGSIDRGIELVGRLSGLGWEPVTNATTEAVFRRALGPAGSGSPDLESFARGALQDLRLQAVAILRVPVEGDRESEVVVITGEDSVTCYPFIATP